jgi:hypothetical protein
MCTNRCESLPACVQARPLTVKDDMKPVVEYLREQGLQTRQVVAVVKGHPPILSYSIGGRIAPLFDYLRSVGFDDPAEVHLLFILCFIL